MRRVVSQEPMVSPKLESKATSVVEISKPLSTSTDAIETPKPWSRRTSVTEYLESLAEGEYLDEGEGDATSSFNGN